MKVIEKLKEQLSQLVAPLIALLTSVVKGLLHPSNVSDTKDIIHLKKLIIQAEGIPADPADRIECLRRYEDLKTALLVNVRREQGWLIGEVELANGKRVGRIYGAEEEPLEFYIHVQRQKDSEAHQLQLLDELKAILQSQLPYQVKLATIALKVRSNVSIMTAREFSRILGISERHFRRIERADEDFALIIQAERIKPGRPKRYRLNLEELKRWIES